MLLAGRSPCPVGKQRFWLDPANRQAGCRPSSQPPVRPRRRLASATRALQVSGPGSTASRDSEQLARPEIPEGVIPSELVNSMRQKIAEALEAEKVDITDTYGDGRHVSIDVVSSLFEGQSTMKRQRMVYKAIWLELQDAVHAVDAMTTRTPAEVSR